MLGVSLFQWWYGRGWLTAASKLRDRLKATFASFSAGLLLQTLFKPWRQIITGPNPNANLSDKFRAFIDNLMSRFIGFWVRIFTLMASLVIALVTAVVGLVGLVTWPLVPLVIIMLIVRSVGGG